MPKKKHPVPATGISLRSSEPVLFYTGGPVYGDAPARDLTAGDLAYLCRVAALHVSGGDPVGRATGEDLAALAVELVATGAFTTSAPDVPPEPIDDPATAEPAGPADEE